MLLMRHVWIPCLVNECAVLEGVKYERHSCMCAQGTSGSCAKLRSGELFLKNN